MVQMLPSRQQILDWIADNPDATAKRDIAKAFNIKGSARIELKRLLRELEAEGLLERRRRSYRDFERLPPVSVVEILPPDDNGDLFARPLEWQGAAPMPRILFLPRRTDPAVGAGERVLVRLAETEGEDHQYEARLMRRIGTAPHRIVGIFRKETEGGRILPIDKGADKSWRVRGDATLDAQDGELVEAEQVGSRLRLGLPQARIIERLGDPSAPRAVSLIAIHQYGIPDDFPDAALAEAEAAVPATMKGRDDLRDVLVPINKKWPIKELLEACRNYPGLSNARRITFEYVMLDGINDSDADARELVRLLAGIPAKINLIPFNPWPGTNYGCSSASRIERFADIVNRAGYASPVRTPRGRDIFAACGQLKSESERLSRKEREALGLEHALS